MSNGVVSEAWRENSQIPYYVGSDDKFEFMYFSDNLKDNLGYPQT